MKIEKKKITGIKSISLAAKSTLAATLGMLGALTLNACDDSTSASSDPAPTPASEDSQPTSSSATTGDSTTPESSSPAETLQSSSEQAEAQQSSSEQAETSQSSSSQVVVDIPLSHEPISSSVLEAISSALESSSSAAEPASATDSPTSSSADTATSAANPATSSETVEPASSSSSEPSIREIQDACQGKPGGSPVDIGGQVYLCPDTGGGMMFSMLSTFERTDAEV